MNGIRLQIRYVSFELKICQYSILTLAAILDFEENEKFFKWLLSWVNLYAQSQSDERDPFAKPICHYWGKNLSKFNFDPERPSWILSKMKILFKGLFLWLRSTCLCHFFPNQMNGIQMPIINVTCGVKFIQFWTFGLRKMDNSSIRDHPLE